MKHLKLVWLCFCSILLIPSNLLIGKNRFDFEIPIYTKFKIDSSASNEDQINQIINLMTLDEKIGQMTQVRHFYDINPRRFQCSSLAG